MTQFKFSTLIAIICRHPAVLNRICLAAYDHRLPLESSERAACLGLVFLRSRIQTLVYLPCRLWSPAYGISPIKQPSARGVKTSRRVAQYLESDVTSFKTEKGGDRGGDRGNGTNNSRKGDDGNGGGGGSVRLFRCVDEYASLCS